MNAETVEKKISAVILCAGQGSRMGGELKALLPLNNHTFLDEVIEQISSLPFEEILLVSGFESHRIREHIKNYKDSRIKVTNNSLYVTGLFRSIKSGVKALFKRTDAVMIILVDQPLISRVTYNQIYQVFLGSTGKSLWRITHKNNPSHPVIISSKYFSEIISRIPTKDERDRGCQFLFKRNPAEVTEIPIEDQHAASDIDTQKDFEQLKQRGPANSAAQ